jgi:hypothetical protein
MALTGLSLAHQLLKAPVPDEVLRNYPEESAGTADGCGRSEDVFSQPSGRVQEPEYLPIQSSFTRQLALPAAISHRLWCCVPVFET